MDWPICNKCFLGHSPFHGWVIRPSAWTDYHVVGESAENERLNHDLAYVVLRPLDIVQNASQRCPLGQVSS